MSIKQEVDLLRRIPLFENIDLAKIKLLAFASERICFEQGNELCTQGEIGDAAYVIIDGEADVTVENNGQATVVATLGKNAFVGEISILTDVPRTATVTAKTRVEALRITKELFYRMISEFPQMGLEIMRVLSLRLADTTRDLTEARAKLKAAG